MAVASHIFHATALAKRGADDNQASPSDITEIVMGLGVFLVTKLK